MVGIGEGPILAKDLTTEEIKTRPKAKKPVKVCDTTFRDGHQSSIATRMRTEDMEPIAPEMNKCGFYAMEVWGGATFDVPHRFLGEDPWERPRLLKKLMPDTPLQMLLRGQNLVAYRNHPDDLVRAFVHHAAEVGIDIFRVFDAVNDERNHEMAYKAIKETGKHIQGAVCYSLTQPRMGGPVYNLDYYVNKSLILQDMGADSICIKDLKAIEAGVDIIDTALAPFALRSSQPAIEPIVVALYGTDRDTGLDIEQLVKCGDMVEQIAPKYRDFVDTSKMAIIDAGVLIHQIPGGMTTNLVSQLKQADALDRLGECQKMTAKTRAELGYPPLVTPTSQIVGVQAVQNVLVGPYEMISKEVKDYCWGLYGKPPAPIDPKIQKMVLKGYERGEKPITCRAADMVEPELEKAREETKDIAKDIGDTLLCALYPTTGKRFLRWKYGLDPTIPDDWKPPRAPKTMEDVKREDELIAKALKGELVEKVEKEVPAKGPGVRTYNVFVEDEYYKVEVEPTGAAAITGPVAGPTPRATQPAPKPEAAPQPATVSEPAPVAVAEGEVTVLVPMPGTLIRYVVNVGDRVKAGDTVVMLEAMKMENAIPAPADGVIKALNFGPGASVKKGDVLAVIAK